MGAAVSPTLFSSEGVADLWSLVLSAVQKVVNASRVPRSDAEDIAGQALCKVVDRWRSAPDAVRSWTSYACGIARRECSNYRRARRRDLLHASLEERFDQVCGPEPISDLEQNATMASEVKRALRASLRTAHQLAVFQLHFELRFSPHDIAQALGCQVKHVNRDIASILGQAGIIWATWTTSV